MDRGREGEKGDASALPLVAQRGLASSGSFSPRPWAGHRRTRTGKGMPQGRLPAAPASKEGPGLAATRWRQGKQGEQGVCPGARRERGL